MELVTGGDLFDRICHLGRFDEVDARGLTKNLLEVLEYLHSKGIVHRDIKPENVLMVFKDENTTIKVTDFGLAKHAADGLHTVCGTPQYFAPEIQALRGGHAGSYSSAVVSETPLIDNRTCGRSACWCSCCWRESCRSARHNYRNKSCRRTCRLKSRVGGAFHRWRRI